METTNLLAISDTHIGCQHGLCAPEGHRDDEGGRRLPSPLQLKLWAIWREMLDSWLPWATRGEPFDLLMNGDAVDGVHHGSVTQWTHNLTTQADAARDILQPVCSMAARVLWGRGTEAHVGQSAQDEERLARELGAIPNEAGQYARPYVRTRVGPSLIDAHHHIGVSGAMASQFVAPGKEMEQCFVDCARWGLETPDVFVRSHRHRHTEQRIEGHKGNIIMVVTPGWQLRTPFTYKMLGGRATTPEFGAVLIRHADGETFTRSFVRAIVTPNPEVAA